ncbi:MAG: hypothetical protein WCH58_02475 [Candidatus Saccharibacteria bacterium]
MNRKYILLVIAIILSSFAILTTVFYFGREVNTISPLVQISTTTNYTVTTQLEQLAKIAVPAVENFDTQDINESTNNRNSRLSMYFSGDSQVYNYKLQNLNSNTIKTTTKTISVVSSESESTSQRLVVNIQTTLYSNSSKTTTKTQSYWVKMARLQDGTLIANDIGVTQ